MSRVRPLAATLAVLGLTGALVLTGCSNSSSTSAASSPAASASAAASSAAPVASAAPSAPSDAASVEASQSADAAAADTAIPENLTPKAFCLLAAPLYDEKARPTTTSQSEAAVVLTAKRLIKGTQALGQAERLKALTGKQVAEIQVTIAILLTLWQNPDLEKGTIEDMSKASGVDVQALKAAQTKGFQQEAAAALADLKKFCA